MTASSFWVLFTDTTGDLSVTAYAPLAGQRPGGGCSGSRTAS
jgi:hypothetical protein